MSKFIKLKTTALTLRMDNVDTDQIIPARYLLMITKSGYGDHLFNDWRYFEDGSENANFVLNQNKFKGSQILLAGENFGSGSSREHAVWAITQYGFKAVIAPSFSDIFQNNAYGNGLLVFTLPKEIVSELMNVVEKNSKTEFEINLPNQTLTIYAEKTQSFIFEINNFVKEKIQKGLDNIGYILSKEEKIKEFEEKQVIL
ncbi:3-isopropylmalate dehydratase small subunit [Candidatus Dojkabacteria bacterium]|nr:3-isopropylmalate dehydratase small subunit [Candidatus Dojkabacteria bacterium]